MKFSALLLLCLSLSYSNSTDNNTDSSEKGRSSEKGTRSVKARPKNPSNANEVAEDATSIPGTQDCFTGRGDVGNAQGATNLMLRTGALLKNKSLCSRTRFDPYLVSSPHRLPELRRTEPSFIPPTFPQKPLGVSSSSAFGDSNIAARLAMGSSSSQNWLGAFLTPNMPIPDQQRSSQSSESLNYSPLDTIAFTDLYNESTARLLQYNLSRPGNPNLSARPLPHAWQTNYTGYGSTGQQTQQSNYYNPGSSSRNFFDPSISNPIGSGSLSVDQTLMTWRPNSLSMNPFHQPAIGGVPSSNMPSTANYSKRSIPSILALHLVTLRSSLESMSREFASYVDVKPYYLLDPTLLIPMFETLIPPFRSIKDHPNASEVFGADCPTLVSKILTDLSIAVADMQYSAHVYEETRRLNGYFRNLTFTPNSPRANKLVERLRSLYAQIQSLVDSFSGAL